jgi:hypothetical protein
MGVDPDADADGRSDATTCVDTILRSWLACPSGMMRRSEAAVDVHPMRRELFSAEMSYAKSRSKTTALPSRTHPRLCEARETASTASNGLRSISASYLCTSMSFKSQPHSILMTLPISTLAGWRLASRRQRGLRNYKGAPGLSPHIHLLHLQRAYRTPELCFSTQHLTAIQVTIPKAHLDRTADYIM